MSWFVIALIAPLIWSLVNHCDKFILSRYFKGGGAGGLMIFVGLVAIPLGAALYVTHPDVLSISFADKMVLIASGILYNIAVLLYLFALERHDASYVVPFWQLTPVFAYLLGVVLLGETVSAEKILAGLIVLGGALLLSLKFQKGEKTKIDGRTILIMVSSSLILALGYILFKDSTAEDASFVISMFWNQVGMLIFALVCFCIRKFRNEFIDAIDSNSTNVLGLNIIEQIFETLGVAVNNFAILLAPAAIVILIEYTAQPMFVFLFGIIFTLVFPKFIKEDISGKNLMIKFTSILIMAFGVYLIMN